MNCLYVDIKSENQVARVAVAQFLCALDDAKAGGYKVIKVLHGYGSHGTGGVIKAELAKELKTLVEHKKIGAFYFGEQIGEGVRELLMKKCPDLFIDKDIYNRNAGVCFVCV